MQAQNQSLPVPNSQNPSKSNPSVAQQGLVVSSLPQSATAPQSVALTGIVYATLPSSSLSSVLPPSQSSSTSAAPPPSFFPISYSHPVFSGISGGVITPVGQSESSYGVVKKSIGLEEGLVERLEDIVSTQFGEDGKEGELEHER